MSTDAHDNDAEPEGHDPASDDCGCGSSGSEDCDPDLLDDLTCRAAGVAAQAAYNAEAKPALDEARQKYSAVRTDYRKARSEAALEVQDLRHQVKQLIERVRCQFEQKKHIDCLDDAFCEVVKELKKCGGTSGCCSSDPCEFDVSCPPTLEELQARLAEYAGRLQREKDCFDRLAAEPAAVTARVAAAKAEIAAAAAELEGDQAVLDVKKVYVALLVAQRHLQQVWGGFKRTQDFLDCLCHALTCWIKATEAVSVLTGHAAVKECRRDAARKRCTDLAEHTADEVLLAYERLCGDDPCADPDEDPPEDECEEPEEPEDDCDDDNDDDSDDGDDDEEHDPDCDCGNEHHHRHHHGRRPDRQQKQR